MYHIFRLVLIALIITYFMGCIFFFMSANFNFESDVKNNKTFVYTNDLTDQSTRSDVEKLAMICYFALTTFSTVGYGDMFPVSSLEMIFGVLIMLFGVGFFSFIMGSLMEIMQSYDAKMGQQDKSGDLKLWISNILRFPPNS